MDVTSCPGWPTSNLHDTCSDVLFVLFRDELRKVRSSSASYGGGKRRVDKGDVGDGGRDGEDGGREVDEIGMDFSSLDSVDKGMMVSSDEE